MAVDISQQAYQAIYQAIQKILGGREEAAAYAEDPKGYLAGEGVADYDLSSVNLQQVVQQAAYDSDAPAHAKQALQQSYAGGGGGGGSYGPPPAPAAGIAPADQLVQHINHVTHVTYEGDDYITQQLINQENYDYSSYSNVNVEGKFYGDVAVDTSTVTATDGGVASTGSGDVTAATGDQAVAAGHDATGVATGDGAVAAGHDINGPVNTGTFTGAQAGGDIGNSVVGDGNTVVGDVSGSNLNLGGEQTNIQDSHLHESAVGGGNVQTSKIDIDADDGSSVAFGAGSKASGAQDNTNVNANQSNVQTGDGTQKVDQSQTEIDKSINDSYNQDSYNEDSSINDSYNTEVELNLNAQQEHAEEAYGPVT